MPSPDDRMGLLGFSYLLDLNPSWYLGVSGYGAVSGDRGGFFTGGLSGGFKFPLTENLWLDTGLFVGGGGGGAAAQGGGLMLRPHAGVSYDFDSFRIGAAASRIDFPNGEIESQHLVLTLDVPFNSYRSNISSNALKFTVADLAAAGHKNVSSSRQEVIAKSRRYFLSDSSRTTSGAKTDQHLDLVGVEFRRFFSSQGFFLAEAMGAFGGDADGYAEVLFGTGYRVPLTPGKRLSLIGTLAAGGAGGGEIDTGGGAIVRTEVEVEYRLTPTSMAALNSGYIDAVDGNMAGWILGLKLGMTFDTLTAGSGGTPLSATDQLNRSDWRYRSSHLSYLKPERLRAYFHDQDVHLFGIKIDHFVRDNIYFTGQAAGAYKGNAGGYATGMFGLGWLSPRLWNSNWQLTGELLAGAGGGGGIAVGEGALLQPSLGIEYALNDRFSLQVMGGQVLAIDGDLNSTTGEVSLCYRFANLVKR